MSSSVPWGATRYVVRSNWAGTTHRAYSTAAQIADGVPARRATSATRMVFTAPRTMNATRTMANAVDSPVTAPSAAKGDSR